MSGVGKLVGIGIKSALEEGVEQVPAKTLKGAQGAENALARTGVKKEELEFSRVLDDAPEGQQPIATEDLKAKVAQRPDQFGVEEAKPQGWGTYESIRPESLPSNSTYREEIYTFSQDGKVVLGNSEHFSNANYLAHARRQDAMLGGQRTRVVLEIQSDLHQKQIGGNADALPAFSANSIDEVYDRTAALVNSASPQARSGMFFNRRIIEEMTGREIGDVPENVKALLNDSMQDLQEAAAAGDKDAFMFSLRETFGQDPATLLNAPEAVKAPWKDNWFTKVLERQMDQAAQDGVYRVAIPLSGSGTEGLHRSARVAQTYATQHRRAMQKLAKRHGWTYKEHTEGFAYQANAEALIGALENKNASSILKHSRALIANLPEDNPAARAAQAVRGITQEELDGPLGDQMVEVVRRSVKSAMEDKVVYGVIEFGQEGAEAAPQQALKAAVEAGDEEAVMQAGSALASVLKDGPAKDLAELFALGMTKNYNPAMLNKMMGELESEVSQTLKPSKRGGFSLYSSPAAGAFAAYTMLRSKGEEETRKNMASQGMDEGEIEDALKDAELIARFTEAGASEAQIKAWFEAKQPKIENEDTTNPLPVSDENYYNEAKLPSLEAQIAGEGAKASDNVASVRRQEQAIRARELLSSEDTLASNELFGALRVLHPDQTFLTTTVSGWMGNEENAQIAYQNAERSSAQIKKTLAEEFGVNASWNPDLGVWVNDDTGQEMTLGMWDDIWQDLKNSRYEMGYGTAGAITGAKIGSKRGGWLGGFAGSLVGGVFGAAVGSNLDYMREAFRLDQEMQGAVAARKALNAAELGVIGDTAAAAVIKVFGATIRGGKRVLQYARGGDIPSATKSLLAHMAITEDEATEIAKQLARLSEVPGKTQAEKNIAAVAMTQPGGERLLKAATTVRPRAGQALIRSVDERAQALLKHTGDLQDPQAARIILEDLGNYRTDVKQFFSDVKVEAAQSVNAGNFSFDYDKLALEPVLNSLKKEIIDPTARLRYINQVKKIKHYSKTRSFTDLIELRQLVNNLTYSGRVRNAKDFKALNEVIANIDDQIEKGAKLATDNADEWLPKYREANRMYAEMKDLENNQLYKLITRKGMSANGIAKALARYAPALDDTYSRVINTLPKQTRAAVEGEVFNILSNKYTTGAVGGLRATQFPMLADELKSVPFTTPGARKLRDAVTRLGEVFKNDIPVAQSGGQLQIPHFQSYLTIDPVVRAKFEFASGIFNRVRQMVPGEQQQDLALVNALTKLLDQPLNAKLMDDLVKEAGDRVDIGADLQALANAAAKAAAEGADSGATRVKVYGTGKVQSLKGAPNAQATESIPVHRIASADDVAQIAAAEGINVADKKAMDELLRLRGYRAVQLGTDKIRRID